MKICIYDLSARYEVQVRDSKTSELLISFKLPPALIRKNEKHSNEKYSFFDPDNPDFSSLIDIKTENGLGFQYDNERLMTLTEIMYNLCFSDVYSKEAEEYFNGIRRLLSARFQERGISIDKTVILVPDALPLSNQERLLSYFGRYKTRLLWHSMAIALGMEKVLYEKGKEGEKIALVDEFADIGTFCTKIEIKKENGRAVPCHKIYKKAKGLNSAWYKKGQEYVLSNALTWNVKGDRLSAAYRQSGSTKTIKFNPFHNIKVEEIRRHELPMPDIVSAALIISSSRVENKPDKTGIAKLTADVAEQAFLGAVRFVDYVERGLVPYYDECESFSVVCQNNKEELYYFELVKGSRYLPGGRKIDGNVIDTLFIPKGSKEAKFYFYLGDTKDKDAHLKCYHQEFPIEEPLEENRRLRLSPLVIPGQGYAQIVIEDYERDKLFSPIELDWENMKPAFNKKGQPTTIRMLEQELERSFPPDVPSVKSRDDIASKYALDMMALISKNFSFFNYDINHSIWPNINDYSKGVERFVRKNTFGSYAKKEENDKRFPKVNGIKNEEYVEALRWGARQYLNGNEDYLKTLAWSYLRYDLDGKMIPEMTNVTNRVIKELKERTDFKCPAVHASYVANMLVTEREFETIFLRFQDVLMLKGDGIGNWCRAMYQVLMYTPFIYADNKKISECAKYCMNRLVWYLNQEVLVGAWKSVDNILRVMLYLLKRRVIDKSYYKKESYPKGYEYVVNSLRYAEKKCNDPFVVETIESIIKYMDGKGTLDGIPAPL